MGYRLTRPSCHLAAFIGVLGLAGSLSAQTLVYGNFTNSSALGLNSSATTTATGDGTVLRLLASPNTNQAGSAFTTTLYNATGFSTAFEFRLSSPGGISDGVQTGADGLVFVLQRAGTGSVGDPGSGLGYDGIATSVGVEFDTFLNSSNADPSTNHVGINTNGSVTSQATANAVTRFDNNDKWTAWIDYDGTTVEVRVSNTGTRPGSALLTHSINIASTIGGSTAYVGFTGASGGAYANHDVLAWTFSPSFVSGGVSVVPEPATITLMGLGVLALLGWRRFRTAR
jgi:hypothetical protein